MFDLIGFTYGFIFSDLDPTIAKFPFLLGSARRSGLFSDRQISTKNKTNGILFNCVISGSFNIVGHFLIFEMLRYVEICFKDVWRIFLLFFEMCL